MLSCNHSRACLIRGDKGKCIRIRGRLHRRKYGVAAKLACQNGNEKLPGPRTLNVGAHLPDRLVACRPANIGINFMDRRSARPSNLRAALSSLKGCSGQRISRRRETCRHGPIRVSGEATEMGHISDANLVGSPKIAGEARGKIAPALPWAPNGCAIQCCSCSRSVGWAAWATGRPSQRMAARRRRRLA